MAILTKAQLEALNQSSFPDQSTEAITPAILRNYNTQTIDTLVNSLDTGSFVTSAITASSLITASVNLNTITFTKGNGTTFAVTVNTGSGGGTTDISSLNAFTASQLTINSGLNASTASQQISINNLNSTTASINSSITQLNASSASQQISINALNSTTASLNTSASLSLTTASFSGNTLTFRKGDGTTFGVVIPDVSGSTIPAGTVSSSAQIVNYGIFATTGSNQFIGNQAIDGTLTITGKIIGSQSIFLQPDANDARTLEIYNTSAADTHITASGGELFLGNDETYVLVNTNANQKLVVIRGDEKIVASGSLDISGSLTASLEQGYVWVGNGNGRTVTVATSSFISVLSGSVPAGTVSSSAQITALGFVSSSVTASSLVTASFSGNTLTFTKGDSSTFGVVIPDVSGSVGTTIYEVVYTGESITKGDPLYISGSQGANPTVFKADASNPAKMPVTFVSNETIGAANTTNAIVLGLIEGIDLTGYVAGQSIYVAEGGGWSLNLPSGSNSVTQLLGVVTKGGSGGKGLVLNPGPAQLPGLDNGKLWVGNGSNQPTEISSASFATTGSNVFTGEQTLVDEAGNTVTLSDISGSLVLVAKGVTSGSAGLSHISASASTQVNLILKSNTANSGSLTISGSGNILLSPAAPTAGFRRYVGNQNIAMTSALPQITGSAAYSPGVNFNYFNLPLTFRGPASSSAWAINNNITNGNFNIGNSDTTSANQAVAGGTMSNNMLLAAVNYNAYTTPLVASANFQNSLVIGATTLTAFSSSIQSNNNIFNGNSFTVNNSYFGTASTNAAQRLQLSYNVFGGINSSGLTTSGSNTTTSNQREVIGNTTNGSGIALGAVLNGDSSHLYSTLVHGSNLTVTGSSFFNNYQLGGSAFFGRNNSVNGNSARSSETIFAVGTGTSTSARKTGFLIDSGSNTFVEGTLNVSGSTSFNGAVNITGSLTSSLTQGFVWVGGAGNVSTLLSTSSFATSAITASSLVTASVSGQILTFTKGDASTFDVTLPAGSGSATIPAGTVSSSAQILGYNIFATTGSNVFTNYQVIKSNLTFEEPIAGQGSDNSIRMNSLNQSTLFVSNTSISSGYNSGSILQLTTATGSNGYGFSGSATFQMDANYGGKTAKMQVSNINGVGTAVYGFADRVEFAKAGGFPNTPSDTFRVDATAIELNGNIKVSTSTSGSAGIVNIASGGTVTNSLVSSNSIILVTTQQLGSGQEYPASVSGKTDGSFVIDHNFGSNLNVAYLIINPI